LVNSITAEVSERITPAFHIDLDAGGSIDGVIAAVEAVIAESPADVRIIPGHGPVSSLGDMRTYLAMLRETRDTVQKALNQGKTLDQMSQAQVLHPWHRYSRFMSEDTFLKTLNKSLTGQKVGGI